MKEGWKYGTINDFCNVNYGTRVVRRNVTGDKYPVYGGGGETFRMDEYNREDCLVVARFAMSKQCTRIVKGKFFLNDSGLTVSPKESSGLDAKLLDRYLLASNDLIYSYGRGSAQINLNVDEFRNMPLSFPKSLSEQQSIVNYLDSAFAKIDAMKANAEKALNEAKALFQASLKEMLEPKEGWEEKKLKEVVISITDGDHQPPPKSKDGIPFITISNIDKSSNKIIFEDTFYVPQSYFRALKKDRIPKNGDVLYTVTGSFGIPVLIDFQKEFCFQRHIALIRPNIDILSPTYLFYWILSIYATSQAEDTATGAAQRTVSLNSLRNFTIHVPPLSEQQSIVAALDSLKSKVDRLQENYNKISQECDTLKQALLRQVFE